MKQSREIGQKPLFWREIAEYFYDRLGSMRTRVTDRQADAAGYMGPAEGYRGSKIAV